MESQALTVIGQQETALAPPRMLLDRDNLNFFANMIEAAHLIPLDKNVPTAVAKSRVMAKICAGQAYGFDPINAQENLHVINGKLTLSARGFAVLLNRSGRYATRVKYLEDDGCVLVVLRKNANGDFEQIGIVSYRKADAEKSGVLNTNPTWKKYPKDMYYASCIRRVVRRFAPEVLDGAAVDYELAKRPAAAEPEVAPQLANGTAPAPAYAPETYTEEVYEPADTDDGFEPVTEAEPVDAEPPVDPNEAKRLEFVDAIESKLAAAFELDVRARDKVLKGRVPANMPLDRLQELYAELCGEE